MSLSDPGAKRQDGMPRGTPFAPGVSGNPNGRPKTRFTTSDYLNLAKQKCTPEQFGEIVARHVNTAIKDPDPKAALESAKWLGSLFIPDAKAVEEVVDEGGATVTFRIAPKPTDTVAPPTPEPTVVQPEPERKVH